MGLITRSADLQFSQLDGDYYAVDSAAGRYISLNETAGRIWHLLQQPQRIDDLVQQLCLEFDVSPADCRVAVLRTIRQLQAAGAVAAPELPDA